MALTVDIRKDFGAFRLNVQFSTGDGPLALLGASGCGKSVTLKCISGILRPDEGRITLDGETLFDSAARIDLPPQRRRVGYLFQQYALFPHMTVRQNIEAAARDRKVRRILAGELLERFRLGPVAHLRPGQLSGGQQQRTALARILASSPQAILLDEPFSALDSYLRAQLETDLAETLSDFPGPVVWVSHDRGEVFRNCRRVCVVENGASQGTFTLRELFHAPGTEAAARLSGCENFAGGERRNGELFLPDWGLTLRCGKPLPAEPFRVGIRARHIRPAEPEAENGFPCRIRRVVQDVFTTVVLLTPETAAPDAPPVRMELPRETWTPPADGRLWAAVQPGDILLLK